MPTILRLKGYRYYFYSHEPNEPPHIHIDRAGMSAKFWLDPGSFARNRGFSPRELRELERMVAEKKRETIGGLK
jgi:hypothetical protein